MFGRRKLTAIASMTVATNQTLNIEDAYKDKRFDKQIDLASGFLTRSVLCKPIADAQGCAGILQLVNKMPVGRFDATDEDFINIFGAFCSILISLKQAFDGRAKVVSIFEFASLNFNEILYKFCTANIVQHLRQHCDQYGEKGNNGCTRPHNHHRDTYRFS